MKKIFGALGLATMLCATARAQTPLTAWTFDNLPIGINSSPSPSTGLGSATALGMDNSYNNTNSISNPDVQSLAGSSAGGPNCWRIRGYSTIAGSRGNGWSTNAPIGTQGAEFDGSTLGYYQIKVSFDVYATADAEANLLVQYTTDGSTWNNANIASAGSLGTIATNTSDPNTVIGSYVVLKEGWNNQIAVNLTGLSGVDNNPNFAIRLVNASSGASCLNTGGTIYDNTSGNWSFDNVVIQGRSIDTIADWTFESEPNDGTVITNPIPEIGGSFAGQAHSIGFNNDYTFADGISGSTDGSDVKNTGGSSSGNNGPNAWRVRGNGGPTGENGWNTEAPIGTQGAQYDVDTSGYSNIVCSFDLYFTSQGEAKMCVLYTTNGWLTTNVAQTLFSGAYPEYMNTNDSDPDTVMGTYFYQTNGQGFYNDFVVDFTGVPGVANNPSFGFSIVNAATGGDCVNFTGGSYNNSSGNWRYDNVVVGGTAGTPAPTIAYDPNASVDGPFTNTFTDNPGWRSKISVIYVNGLLLTNAAYNTTIPGELVFTPSESPLLQSSGDKNFVIIAPGYGTGRFTQPLAAGVATQLAMTTQAAGPSASGGTLTANPVLGVLDQYGNGTTNPYPDVSATASVGGSGGWTLGGATTQASVGGIMAFTNLTATVNGSSAVSNAFITFTVTGYPPLTVTNSALFNIGAPPVPFTPGNLAVLQIDTVANNTTFSIIELNPSAAGQTSPVNIVPISATGTNALRQSSSGSTGRLALSDDGRLLGFAAFLDGSSATPDETFNYNRAAAGMNYAGQLVMGLRYTSVSPNGSQARSACVLDDDQTWIADDKGGLYEGNTNSGSIPDPNLNNYNNVVVRTFGGTPFVETQKTANGEIIPAVYTLGLDPYTGLYDVTVANNLVTDPNASDFYLVSTDGGATYNVLYIADQNSATQGVINKYSLTSGTWTENPELTYNGSFTNSSGIDGLFATTNGNGGVDLFYTTGSGGTPGNSVVRVKDAAGWNQNIDIVSSNVIYTTSKGTSLKGLTFVPQEATNAPEPTPPPVLAAQSGATAGSSFSVTFAPDDPAWRSAITNITVDGSALSSSAYTIQSGEIVFNPLQGAGMKTIVIGAAGYSDDTVGQNLSVLQSVLSGVSVNGSGNLTFSFTNAPNVSFSVLGTNNLSAPIDTWPVIGTATESPAGSGHYQFVAPNAATNGAEFYILRQP
jgi:Heme-binding protein Shr-like, Hb-interacting domain